MKKIDSILCEQIVAQLFQIVKDMPVEHQRTVFLNAYYKIKGVKKQSETATSDL